MINVIHVLCPTQPPVHSRTVPEVLISYSRFIRGSPVLCAAVVQYSTHQCFIHSPIFQPTVSVSILGPPQPPQTVYQPPTRSCQAKTLIYWALAANYRVKAHSYR